MQEDDGEPTRMPFVILKILYLDLEEMHSNNFLNVPNPPGIQTFCASITISMTERGCSWSLSTLHVGKCIRSYRDVDDLMTSVLPR